MFCWHLSGSIISLSPLIVEFLGSSLYGVDLASSTSLIHLFPSSIPKLPSKCWRFCHQAPCEICSPLFVCTTVFSDMVYCRDSDCFFGKQFMCPHRAITGRKLVVAGECKCQFPWRLCMSLENHENVILALYVSLTSIINMDLSLRGLAIRSILKRNKKTSKSEGLRRWPRHKVMSLRHYQWDNLWATTQSYLGQCCLFVFCFKFYSYHCLFILYFTYLTR